MRKKILFVITKSNWGGAQKYVFDLATSLAPTHDVTVALGGTGRLRELLLARGIRVCDIEGMQRDISLKDEVRSWRHLLQLFRHERPHIVHLNSSKAGAIGALAARCAGVRHIVFTAHAWAWNENRPFLARIFIALSHWLTVMLAHRTLCVSHALYDQMAHLPLTRHRMRVIHPGITPLPHLSREQARTQFFARFPELAARAHAPWIATIAELHPVKGLPYALTALTRVRTRYPDVVHIIMGDGELRDELTRTIQRDKLTETVFLAGHITDAPALLPAFDLFVLPSLSESFGYVLLEAGAAGVAVVASAVGGIPEILEEGCGILVPPGNATLLAEGIIDELTNDTTRDLHARTLAHRTDTYFTRERMVDETEAQYGDLLRQRARQQA